MFKRFVILCVTAAVMFGCSVMAQAQSKKKPKPDTIKNPNAPKKFVPIPEEKPDKSILGWKPLAEGDVGKLYDLSQIVQIIDEDNALVDIGYVSYEKYPHVVRETVWIKMPTKGMIDDKVYRIKEYFKVTGTTQYKTASGTRTVMKLEVTENPEPKAAETAKQKADAERAAAEEKRKAEKVKQTKADTRTWTDAASGDTMKATFITRIADKVTLKKEDGTTVRLQIHNLSKADQEWVENRSKK